MTMNTAAEATMNCCIEPNLTTLTNCDEINAVWFGVTFTESHTAWRLSLPDLVGKKITSN